MTRIVDHNRIPLRRHFLALHLWDAASCPDDTRIVSVWERRRGDGVGDLCWISWEGALQEDPDADGRNWPADYAFVPLTHAEWDAIYMLAAHLTDPDLWAQQALRVVGLTRADLVDLWNQTVG